MVKGERGINFEENLWSSLSSTVPGEVVPSDGRSWPLVVFTGILVAAPYFVHKLLNTVVPMPNPVPPMNNTNGNIFIPNYKYCIFFYLTITVFTVLGLPSSGSQFVIRSPTNWISSKPKTISLIEGQKYWTCDGYVQKSLQNGGWLYVRNANGQRGFVPVKLLQQPRMGYTSPPLQPPFSGNDPNVVNAVEIPSEPPQHMGSQVTTTPITNGNDNPIILPHPPTAYDPLEEVEIID